MIHPLFERFLDDPAVYFDCVQFWRELANKVACWVEGPTDWHSWIPRSYADGTPMDLDGNPIWDGRSHQLDRAYRIIQDIGEGDEIEIAAWVTSYDQEYEEMPRHELVIHLSLSKESADLAEALLRKWMTPTTTPDVMREVISKLIPSKSHI
jgi:hypothetical protein